MLPRPQQMCSYPRSLTSLFLGPMISTANLTFLSVWALDVSERIWDQLAHQTLLSCSPGDWNVRGGAQRPEPVRQVFSS